MSLKLQVHGGVASVGREAWDSLAAPTGDPFVTYDFLDACEASGSAVPEQGWAPRHLTLHAEDGTPVGAMPLYLKGHSQGEYVFDHSWADAYQRAGGRYYPKLLCAIPFTPATGPRLLVALSADPDTVRQGLIQGAVMLCEQMGLSSLHVNFPTEAEWSLMGQHRLMQRQDIQFIWRNQGWATFDDFLGALSASRRKTIRRERREAQDGLDIRILSGDEITEAHWDAFFAFYIDTGDRKWGRPYLTRDFFTRIGLTMADKVALVMAFNGETPVAGAINFIGRDALYGRQWGTLIDKPFLHFELCYYQAIEFALKNGLSRVEAGAQGDHKIARGYLPSPVYSAHYISDPALADPVARYLKQEGPAVAAERDAMTRELSPFRQA
ncbi:GNAT family N-acetyltransferase [uncultured Brevundimonas sp.]|uniref:GNAT family N-acetyltransferase n=1 Tax=uncultured Brevundimonas sp. TaxID=213418 RepID=UPI0026099665|nr:GNAT family N-acetyltransferase [uncultured Brevundimonas sp.]